MKFKERILLVDDEKNVLRSLSTVLRKTGIEIDTANSAQEALAKIPRQGSPVTGAAPYDAVVLDLKMPGMDGIQLLKKIRSRTAQVPIIILTGYGTIQSAVEAIRAGAYEFLVKPTDPAEIMSILKGACRRGRAAGTAASPGSSVEADPAPYSIVGSSPALREALELVDRVAPRASTVLLRGDSGTGKELIARRIHSHGPRPGGPFVGVNCATVTSSLAESLFFGHVKGAFTGAESDRMGFFRAAAGGTLFLDEIEDLPLETQGVLLRTLEDGSLTPLGDTRSIKVDARIISASNCDLDSMVSEGRFREDLYYRLNVVRIIIPPLRERIEDIPLLVEHFLSKAGKTTGEPIKRFDGEALDLMLHYPWPGNVRELRNVIEGVFVVTDGLIVKARDLPCELRAPREDLAGLAPLDAGERVQIQRALQQSGGVKKAAAALLGIDRKRLYRKMKRLGLRA
jgi:DNA-binding NtrC family response regulator